ncbi:nuclear transport factor 2 family protein [Nocardia sp. NBC_00511]|uniref:nuclear transport factor 2 family protein n=1 Tax=Nocardia sp. NBC_00511 TaxID=2903591 RepID=UPI0030E4CE80
MFTDAVDNTVSAVLRAIEAGDWTAFAKLVHPYVLWTENGVTTRGRTRVMALLSGHDATAPANSYELRDEQVYRWVS